jgi:hypothetical protein
MTKTNQCTSTDSDTSAPSDFSCKKSVKDCDAKDCDEKDCVKLCPEEIFCKYADATVQVNGEFWIQKDMTNGAKPVDEVKNNKDSMFIVVTNGSGFFIKGGYLVCPASLVMAPSTISSAVGVYPFQVDPASTTKCDVGEFGCCGKIKDYYIKATKISVVVNNVNGKCYSFNYDAKLVGVCPASDVAVLFIDSKNPFNKNNPCIEKTHPYFKFGSSKKSKNGSRVYLIGDANASKSSATNVDYSTSFVEGILNNNRFVDPKGDILAECVSVTAPVFGYSTGLPILDECARVIGMQTTAIMPEVVLSDLPDESACELEASADASACPPCQPNTCGDAVCALKLTSNVTSMGKVCGPSEFFMRRIIRELINGTCNRRPDSNKNIKRVGCGSGAFNVYKKGYLGIAYSQFAGAYYDKRENYDIANCCIDKPVLSPCGVDDDGCCPNKSQQPQTTCYQVAGIRIEGLAGKSPNGLPTPDGNQKYAVLGSCGEELTCNTYLPNPHVADTDLKVGDVITSIDGCNIASGQKGLAPSLITWRSCEGDCINVNYRCQESCYDGLCSTDVVVIPYPVYLDYPWYALKQFPNIFIQCIDIPRPLNQAIEQLTSSVDLCQGGLPFKVSV